MTCMARDTSWQSAKIGTTGTIFCAGDCPYDMMQRICDLIVAEKAANMIQFAEKETAVSETMVSFCWEGAISEIF